MGRRQSTGAQSGEGNADGQEAQAWRLALRFAHGYGFVRATDARIDGVCVPEVALRLDHLAFPFDLAGGAESFRGRTTSLWRLALQLDGPTLAALCRRVPWHEAHLDHVRVAPLGSSLVVTGFVQTSGRDADATVGFAVRLAPAPLATGGWLKLLAYDVRFFGGGPATSADVLVRLQAALTAALRGRVEVEDAAALRLRPAQAFARLCLPRVGWKVAASHALAWTGCTLTDDGLQLALQHDAHPATQAALSAQAAQAVQPAGPAGSAGFQTSAESAGTPRLGEFALAAARAAAQAIAQLGEAEAALSAGRHLQAFAGYQRLVVTAGTAAAEKEAAVAVPWAARRLLELAPALPAAADAAEAERRQVALRRALQLLGPEPIAELFAARQAPTAKERASRYVELAGRSADVRWTAAERALCRWAAAGALAAVDPGVAADHLMAARAAGLNAPSLFAPLFGLLRGRGETTASRQVAEDWLACLSEAASAPPSDDAVADVHLRLAQVLDEGGDVGGARTHLEQALACAPEHAAAQAALARLYAAAGENGRARALLAAMAEQAERRADVAAAHHLLAAADIWEQALGDATQAQALREAARGHAPWLAEAVLPLCAGYEAAGQNQRSVDLLHAFAGTVADAQLRAEAWVRLADHAERGTLYDGCALTAAQQAVAYLQDALHVAPAWDEIRHRLCRLYAAQQQWPALAGQLAGLAAAATRQHDHAQARTYALQAAEVQIAHAVDVAAAGTALAALLERDPSDAAALALLLPLLDAHGDAAAAAAADDRLARAIAHETAPLRRGPLQVLAAERAVAAAAPAERQLAAWRAVQQSLPQHLVAARAIVRLLQADGGRHQADDDRLAAYLALAAAATVPQERGEALFRAAQLCVWLERPAAALGYLERSLHETPARQEAWLLGADVLLARADAGPAAAEPWLRRALAACGGMATEAEVAQPGQNGTTGGARQLQALHLRLADVCAATHNGAGELAALQAAAETGGCDAAGCERLLRVLQREGQSDALGTWLMRWADAGWPLPVGQTYMRAAAAWAACGRSAKQVQALRRAVDCGGPLAHEAGRQLEALGVATDDAQVQAWGLAGQLAALADGVVAPAAGADAAVLEERLMWAQLACDELAAAEASCCRLLAADAQAPVAHAFLGALFVRRRLWEEALDHLIVALSAPVPLTARVAHSTVATALALAADLRPASRARLQTLASRQPAGAAAAAQAPSEPMSARLRAQKDWEGLRTLLACKLARCSDEASRAPLRLQAAEVAFAHLGDAAGAEVLLRQNLAADPRDMASRQALLPIYVAQKDDDKQAELHVALAQASHDAGEALAHTLAAARLHQGRRAAELLAAFVQRHDLPPVFPQLWAGFAEFGLTEALQAYLAHALTVQPGGDDGRLAKLCALLAQRGAYDKALAWCRRLQSRAPADEAPWRLSVELLRAQLAAQVQAQAQAQAQAQTQTQDRPQTPSRTDDTTADNTAGPDAALLAAYAAWAEAREGEARAAVLSAQADWLREAGHAKMALATLEQALAVANAAPAAHAERLRAFGERALAQGQAAVALAALAAHAGHLPAGAERDATYRRLADLAAGPCHDAAGAERMLAAVDAPTPADLQAQAQHALATGALAPLVARPAALRTLSAEALAAALPQALAAADLPTARAVANALVAVGTAASWQTHPPVAWLADLRAAWRRADAEADFAGWSLTLAEGLAQTAPVAAACLRLEAALFVFGDAYAAATSEGAAVALAELRGPKAAAELLAATDWQALPCARLAFRLATRLGEEGLHPSASTTARYRGAEALLAAGEEAVADPSLWRDALAAQAQHLLADDAPGPVEARTEDRADAALALADALCARGDGRGLALRARALLLAGRQAELLTALRAQADATEPGQASAVWLQLAQVLLACGQVDEGDAALQRVARLDRGAAWTELHFGVAERRGDAAAQAAAAAARVQLATAASDRATWLRREAAVRWWQLGQPAAAAKLLQAAQEQQPWTAATVLHALPTDDVAAARRRLQEAVVALPQAAQAPLWRKLAELAADAGAEAEALQHALRCAGDDNAELAAIVRAARAAGQADVLRAALVAQGERARSQAPAVAAMAFAEAARLAAAHNAADLWTRAAAAYLAADDRPEARAACERAVAVAIADGATGHHLWAMAWQLLDRTGAAAGKAARALATCDAWAQIPAEDQCALAVRAAEDALAQERDESQLARRWLAAHPPAHAASTPATLPAPTVALAKRWLVALRTAYERTGDAAGLIALGASSWLTAALPPDLAEAWARRAAYLAAACGTPEQAQAAWRRLLRLAPLDDEAVLQWWAGLARNLSSVASSASSAAAATTATQAPAEVRAEADALAEATITGLAAFPRQASRAGLVIAAAALWERVPTHAHEGLRLLGRELTAWLAAWSAPQDVADGGPVAFAPLEALAEAVVRRLLAAGRQVDAMAVSERLAACAPAARQRRRAFVAGRLAQICGDDRRAFRLWLPVVQGTDAGTGNVTADAVRDGTGHGHSNGGGDGDDDDVVVTPEEVAEAIAFCLRHARRHNDARTVVALLTQAALGAAPAAAAEMLAEAADWTLRAGHHADHARRLLQAAHALAPQGPHAGALVAALLAANDAQAVLQAADVLLAAGLPAAEKVALGEQTAARLAELPEQIHRQADVWAAVLAADPNCLPGLTFAWQQAQASGDAAAQWACGRRLLAALPPTDGACLPVLRRLLALLPPAAAPAAAAASDQAASAQKRASAPEAAWLAAAWQQALAHLEVGAAELDALLTAWPADVLRQQYPDLWTALAARSEDLRLAAKRADLAATERFATWTVLSRLAEGAGDWPAALQAQRAGCALLGDDVAAPAWAAGHARLADLLRRAGATDDLLALLDHLVAASRLKPSLRAGYGLQRAILRWTKGAEAAAVAAELATAYALAPDVPGLQASYAEAALAANDAATATAVLQLADPAAAAHLGEALLPVALATTLLAGQMATAGGQRVLERLTALQPTAPAVAVAACHAGGAADVVAGHAHAALQALAAGAPVLEGLHPQVQQALRARVLQDARQLGGAALLAAGQAQAARQLLHEAVAAATLPAERSTLVASLWQACLADEAWEEAAVLAEAQAAQETDPQRRQAALLEAAGLYQTHLGDLARACALTLTAAQCLPKALPVWWRLFALLGASENLLPDAAAGRLQRQQVAEHLLAHADPAHLDADFLCAAADLYASESPARSHALFARAAALAPLAPDARATWQDVAWRAGAFAQYVALAKAEDAAAGAAADAASSTDATHLRRRLRLAVACSRVAELADEAEVWLRRVLVAAEAVTGGQMPSHAVGIWRDVADLCATRPALRQHALQLYVEILHHQPTNVDVLRLAARLAGGEGDVERAYGLYACLLWLAPADDEAGRFVAACRAQGSALAGEEEAPGRGQGRPLVKKVQAALDEVAAEVALPVVLRPARAYDVAQLIRRDIEDVLREMVPHVHGTPRASSLRRLPEALTLFRFAQTPAYFALRRRLARPGALPPADGRPSSEGARLPTAHLS